MLSLESVRGQLTSAERAEHCSLWEGSTRESHDAVFGNNFLAVALESKDNTIENKLDFVKVRLRASQDTAKKAESHPQNGKISADIYLLRA